MKEKSSKVAKMMGLEEVRRCEGVRGLGFMRGLGVSRQ
jgi:hypothetical protein